MTTSTTLGPDMTLYCLVWDGDNGTRIEHYFSEEARAKHIKSEIAKDWNDARPGQPMPDDWFDAWEVVSDTVDYWLVVDDIDLRGAFSQSLAWTICNETPGTFGNLYDPAEIATIMDGWSAEGDESPSSFWFDTDNAEDAAALLAWCEQEGPDFTDQISNLVCDNLPTRAQAFQALHDKRSAENAA